MELSLSLALAVLLSLVLGFSIGLQRQLDSQHRNSQEHLTGVRSFALISLLGALSAYFKDDYIAISLIIAVLFGLLITATFIMRLVRHEQTDGTTQFAALIAFIVGLLVYDQHYIFATFTTVAVILVLQARTHLERFTKQVQIKDLQAIILFLLITFIVLPILPNHPIDPYGLINPYMIWLMVVLISGLSFAGYIAARIIGVSKGIMMTGFFGGFLSSTATTITFSKRVTTQTSTNQQLAAAIALACTTMYARVVIVTAVINPPLAIALAPAFISASILGYIYIFWLYRKNQQQTINIDMVFKNPLELEQAIQFGLLFGLIFSATSLLQKWAGNIGSYLSALVSGLTDVDAITLSLSTLQNNGNLSLNVAIIAIVIATFANSMTKLAIAYIVGNKNLGNQLLPVFAISLTALAIILILQAWFKSGINI